MPVTTEELTWFGEQFAVISDNIEHVIQGKRETVELVASCLISGGHTLIEDVPGVGKTLLAKSLARARSTAHSSGSNSPPTCSHPT